MKLTSLELLHTSMRAKSSSVAAVDMQQFFAQLGAVGFDCLFSAREVPYVLALTARGALREFFKFEVTSDYEVPIKFDFEFYGRLAKTLQNTREAGNRLVPRNFLEELNKQIPTVAEEALVPRTPTEVISLRQDITDQRDKPYFSHWQTPSGVRKDGTPAQASAENKKKTLALLGPKALAHSQAHNLSSHWTAEPVHISWAPGR